MKFFRKLNFKEIYNGWENGFKQQVDHVACEKLVKEDVHDKVINGDETVAVSVGNLLVLCKTEKVDKLGRSAETVKGVYDVLDILVININVICVLVFVSCNIIRGSLALCIVS